MPSEIHMRTKSTIGEDAAILTAFNTFLAAVKAATTHKVDAGGTVIGNAKQSGDEANPYLRQGDPF
jgi:hypothetical protein